MKRRSFIAGLLAPLAAPLLGRTALEKKPANFKRLVHTGSFGERVETVVVANQWTPGRESTREEIDRELDAIYRPK